MIKKLTLSVLSTTLSFAFVHSASAIVTKTVNGNLTELKEDFTQNSNEGGWNFFTTTPTPVKETSNGAYLNLTDLDTFAPHLRTTTSNNVFLGNYYAQKVRSIQLNTEFSNEYNNPLDQRPVTLMLVSGHSAAYKFSDSPLIVAAQKWGTFKFSIPKSEEEAKAAGWLVTSWPVIDSPDKPANIDDIFKNVDQVMFLYGDPLLYYIYQMWNVDATDISITKES